MRGSMPSDSMLADFSGHQGQRRHSLRRSSETDETDPSSVEALLRRVHHMENVIVSLESLVVRLRSELEDAKKHKVACERKMAAMEQQLRKDSSSGSSAGASQRRDSPSPREMMMLSPRMAEDVSITSCRSVSLVDFNAERHEAVRDINFTNCFPNGDVLENFESGFSSRRR